MAASIYKWSILPYLFCLLAAGKVNTQTGGNHPLYVSVVEVNHNATDKTLEISCKIFANDFEKTLKQNYKTHVDLVKPSDKAAMDKLVQDYISKHLSIKLEGKPAAYSYVGFEEEDQAIWAYFQVDNVASVKKIEFTDSILHDFIDLQINIIHCIVGGKRQSTKLDFPNTQASFQF